VRVSGRLSDNTSMQSGCIPVLLSLAIHREIAGFPVFDRWHPEAHAVNGIAQHQGIPITFPTRTAPAPKES
jgi:hypothetical protein